MTDDISVLSRIRTVHAEILRVAPFRDMGLVPNPGASLRKIKKAEERLGRPLPPSYRAFLSRHDGWPRFFEGATLLGTDALGKPNYEELARAAFEAAETPVPDLGPPSRSRRTSIIPFGIDAQATTQLGVWTAAPPAIDGRVLRLRLRPLAPGARLVLPLPVRWSLGGTLRGLGASAWDEATAPSLRVRPTAVLASRALDIPDRGAEPATPEAEVPEVPRRPEPPPPIDIMRAFEDRSGRRSR